eukprot:CAMPEP_0174369690 /NCGR_PEP_ID=MMETSP0811_2-20130205/93370_1 /TAXON_ID=73025 ORGANISM="Eutreptiella gymnastica-like, Strain CCMP1594" /NCGR_SAMPLE_ID=MMETSP0811_2 /ASSEMBLY_ACC=CAM_ASM_000667 /LENGTH=137 /DNA_ID=CAMNT_0015514375 /DNA_START=139 /DNA_END=552 /DNA_ORIENTATION=+
MQLATHSPLVFCLVLDSRSGMSFKGACGLWHPGISFCLRFLCPQGFGQALRYFFLRACGGAVVCHYTIATEAQLLTDWKQIGLCDMNSMPAVRAKAATILHGRGFFSGTLQMSTLRLCQHPWTVWLCPVQFLAHCFL